jgi:hypothetical protein
MQNANQHSYKKPNNISRQIECDSTCSEQLAAANRLLRLLHFLLLAGAQARIPALEFRLLPANSTTVVLGI